MAVIPLGSATSLEELLDDLESAGLRCARLRSDSDEVDVLVHPAQLKDVRAVATRRGYTEVPSWGRGSHRFFRGHDERTDRWRTLDVVTELAFGLRQQFVTALAVPCLERSSTHGAAQQLTDDDAFWSLLLHVLLDKGGVPGRHAERLRELATSARTDGDWGRLLAAMPGGPTPAELIAASGPSDAAALAALGPRLKRAWLLATPGVACARALGSTAARTTTKLRVARRRRGVTVALLGPDGAGKSTLSRELAATLPLPVRQVYAGQYQSGSRTGGPPGWGLTRRVLRQLSTGATGRWHCYRGRVTVYDRYAYDATLTPAQPRLLTRLRRAVLARSRVRPDVVVVLDAPAQTLWERSGEHGVDRLHQQRLAYLGLAERVAGSIVVDAARPADAVRRDVALFVWARCTQQWRAAR